MGEKKTNLKLVTEETETLKKRFDEVMKKTAKQNPAPADMAELKKLLDEHERLGILDRVAGPMRTARTHALSESPVGPAVGEVWGYKLSAIEEELGYREASHLEKMLIQHIVFCWLRLTTAEIQYSRAMSGSNTLALCMYYEKRLSMVQRRFTRACETLVKTRRLMQRIPVSRRQSNVA